MQQPKKNFIFILLFGKTNIFGCRVIFLVIWFFEKKREISVGINKKKTCIYSSCICIAMQFYKRPQFIHTIARLFDMIPQQIASQSKWQGERELNRQRSTEASIHFNQMANNPNTISLNCLRFWFDKIKSMCLQWKFTLLQLSKESTRIVWVFFCVCFSAIQIIKELFWMKTATTKISLKIMVSIQFSRCLKSQFTCDFPFEGSLLLACLFSFAFSLMPFSQINYFEIRISKERRIKWGNV